MLKPELLSQENWLKDVELEKYTSWRVGGIGSHLFKPADLEQLVLTLKQLPKHVPITWLGLGSNTLVRDSGFAGLTILTQSGLNKISLINDNQIEAQAGVSCATFARFCARNNLGKAEFWAGIPGTMGGALRMNAGCFDGETWDHLVSVETVNRFGEVKLRLADDFDIAYRHVQGLEQDEWFIKATFQLPDGDKQSSLTTIKELLARRSATQPTGEYNCGSVFRNPPGNFAAKLIESCGLKGKQIGGAFVSTKHANFITNDGSATAANIESLIEYVWQTVFDETGVKLHREVHIIGAKA